MKDKRFWFDVETTGLDSKACAIISLGFLIEVEGEVVEEGEILMAPGENDKVEEEALRVNRFTLDQIRGFQSQAEGFRVLKNLLGKRVNPMERADKYTLWGFNVPFDEAFLRALWLKFGDKYFGSWFFSMLVDIRTFVGLACARGLRLPNYKLLTLCNNYNITYEAHNSLADVRATRKLYHVLKDKQYDGAL